MELVAHFINSVADELDHLNGSDFEQLCRPFIEILTGKDFELKGHNLELKAVRGSVDLIQDDSSRIIGQCGTDKDYFDGTKPINDIEGSIRNSPSFTTIYLFCNRRATGGSYQAVNEAISKELKNKRHTGYHYHLYDSQRIARKVYENIYMANKVEEILSFLPKSREYYLILPQTNNVPLLKSDYKHRPEENDIEEQLRDKIFVQIYGLSGIGKSQMSIAVANNMSEQFDTVLWFDGESIDPKDLNKVIINRMGNSINLSSVLKSFKTLVIVDNLNNNVPDLFTSFSSLASNGSRCIVSSLQRNVSPDYSYNLLYVSDVISKAILCDCDIKPTEPQLKCILEQIAGYPLLLELSKKAVLNGEMTWDDIVKEANMTEINDDEKNEEFAQRIVGRYKQRFADIFTLLIGLDNSIVNKAFLKEKNQLALNSLFAYSILQDSGVYYCQIHQVVLSAIKAIFNDYSYMAFFSYLQSYLEKHVVARDAGLYTFMRYHQTKMHEIASSEDASLLSRYILLAHLYSVDTNEQPDYFIGLLNTIDLDPDNLDVDLSLFIEKCELEQARIRKESKNDINQIKDKVMSDISSIKKIKMDLSRRQSLIYHHIGKWLSSIEDYGQSEQYLLKAIEIDPQSYHSILRLARDYHKQSRLEEALEKVEALLREEAIETVPISIRLSAYDIISNNSYKELRVKYIDKRLDRFSEDVYASLSESYSHTYIVLAKLAEHLSYNYPDFYSRLCVQLPMPLNIDANQRLRKDYGRIKLAQYLYGNYPSEYKEKLYKITNEYLSGVSKDDYIRKNLIKLYIAGGEPEKALLIVDEFEDQDNKFTQQIICKAYYENGDYPNALIYIEKSIAQENPNQKEYCAAFRHDKAKCLNKLRDPNAKSVMKEAIALQPNKKVKKEWEDELNKWETEKTNGKS